jgi:hypothetical protein
MKPITSPPRGSSEGGPTEKTLRSDRRSLGSCPALIPRISSGDDIKLSIVVWLCLVMLVVFSGCSPARENSIPAYDFERYSLFTWKAPSGDFCFAIIIRADADKFLRSWTAKRGARCGASELKSALAALPKDSYVFWEDWPPKHFDYPPENIVQEIIEFAKSKGVHLEQSPALR